MKNYLLFLSIFVSLNASAQLANWHPAGNLAFPRLAPNSSGSTHGYCRISDLVFHPSDSNKMYAITAEGGLFATVDGGNNWTVKSGTEGLGNYCATVCVDRTNDQLLLLGTGDRDLNKSGYGVRRSIDGGNTFTGTNISGGLVTNILQSSTADSVFVAATASGVYKSTNRGISWTLTASGLWFADVKKNPDTTSNTLYACTNANPSEFYRSANFGSTWTKITSGIINPTSYSKASGRVAVSPSDTNIVYFTTIAGLGTFFLSTDGGLNFGQRKRPGSPNLTGYDTTLASGQGQGHYNNCVTVDKSNPGKLWYVSQNMWTSSDSGATWLLLHRWFDGVHTDAKVIKQAPFNAGKLFETNDGGVFLSTDGGQNWTPKSNGLYAFEIYTECGKGSNTDRNFAIIGTQDNGRLFQDSLGWTYWGTGDDYTKKYFDYLPNGGKCYFPGSGTTRQGKSGGTLSSSLFGLSSTVTVQQYAFNPVATNIGFVGSNGIYLTKNLAATSPTWSSIVSFSASVMAVHSCAADSNRLYVMTSDGKFYSSANVLSSTPTFSAITLPATASSVASIAAIAANADRVYITIDNKVYYSTNAGATWTNVTYNLPNVTHRRILAENFGGTEELVFVATSNAVYYKKAGQTSWTNYSTGLPTRRGPTDFSMFDDGTDSAVIRYATYGRGVWESNFDNLRVLSTKILVKSLPIMDTSIIPTISCGHPNIQFTEATAGKAGGTATYAWSFPGGTPSSSTMINPTVSYPVSGNYSISLTTTKDSVQTSTQTKSRFIQVIPCTTDTIPGLALSVSAGSYATTDTVRLDSTNTITLSCWIKIYGNQPNRAGIMTSNVNGTGLNFLNNNIVGYNWKNSSGTVNYPAAYIPTNKWTHLALVVTDSDATVYVNGEPHNNVYANAAIDLNTVWNLGNDPTTSGRNMNGLIDEACIYKRTLSQTEIRQLMNLTRNHNGIDPSLKAYYQFNELGNTIYDRVGSANATIQGNASRVASSAPVGSGSVQTVSVTSGGAATFKSPALDLICPASGTYPNGDLVVTRLNVPPDQQADNYTLPFAPTSYYIIRNYGTNKSFSSLAGIIFHDMTGISPYMVNAPNALRLYKRGSNDDGLTWGASIDVADSVTDTAGIGSVSFISGLNVTSFSQFTIGAAAVPLPISVLSFDAQSIENKKSKLIWNIASENSFANYEIERSSDAIHFATIGMQDALGKKTYEYMDLNPRSGANYYRIKMQSNAGNSGFSVTRRVNFVVKSQVIINPNPSTNGIVFFSFQGIDGKLNYHATVTDAAGRLVKNAHQENVANGVPYSIVVGQSGLYYLQIELSDGQTFTEKIVLVQ